MSTSSNSNNEQEYEIGEIDWSADPASPDDAYPKYEPDPSWTDPNDGGGNSGSRKGLYTGVGGILAVLLTLALGYFGLDMADILEPAVQPTADAGIYEGGIDIEYEQSSDAEIGEYEGGDINDYYEDENSAPNPEPVPSDERAAVPPSDNAFEYEIFFTEPTCPKVDERSGGLDELIAESIDEAAYQVDIAAFDLDSEPIIDALIAAEKREVFVRVVVDNQHTPKPTIDRLRRNGISVIEDKRSGLMHNKFIVIDYQYLWMGSMNFASNGVYCNNNNVVLFDSQVLSENYLHEMDEMYDEQAFGPTSPKNTTNRLTLGDVKVENYFASENEVARSVSRVVARAESEILFMAFSFTHEDIGEAMIERAEDGVTVKGVFEKNGSDAAAAYFNDFRRAKLDTIEVRKDGNSRVMHHKVILIDREITIFGSFNFSNNANDSNDENLLIVYDPAFTADFIDEFGRVWENAE